MAKKTSSKTKKPAARAKVTRPKAASSKSSPSRAAGGPKYDQAGAPWWKAHLPAR
jgi:hypothetical protein